MVVRNALVRHNRRSATTLCVLKAKDWQGQDKHWSLWEKYKTGAVRGGPLISIILYKNEDILTENRCS